MSYWLGRFWPGSFDVEGVVGPYNTASAWVSMLMQHQGFSYVCLCYVCYVAAAGDFSAYKIVWLYFMVSSSFYFGNIFEERVFTFVHIRITSHLIRLFYWHCSTCSRFRLLTYLLIWCLVQSFLMGFNHSTHSNQSSRQSIFRHIARSCDYNNAVD